MWRWRDVEVEGCGGGRVWRWMECGGGGMWRWRDVEVDGVWRWRDVEVEGVSVRIGRYVTIRGGLRLTFCSNTPYVKSTHLWYLRGLPTTRLPHHYTARVGLDFP